MLDKLKVLSLFALLFTLTCFSCREDDDQPCIDALNPDCPNYDPCLIVFPAIADNIAIIDSVSDVFADRAAGMLRDTLGRGSTVYFRPKWTQENANYEWKIGSDVRLFSDPVLEMDFVGFEGDVEIRLVTTLDDIDNCLLEEERIDTSYFPFYVDRILTTDFPINGIFLGSLDSKPSQEVIIEVYRSDNPISTRIRGFPLDCYGDGPDTGLTGGYDWFVTAHLPGDFRCRELTAIGKLREDDHRVMEIDYTYVDDGGNTVEERFVGFRQ